MKYLEEIIAHGVQSPDEREGRVYGWLPGVVTDIDTKLMRVKARIGKQEDGDSTDWLIPASGGSIEELPEIGDPITVDFMDGDPHRGRWSWFPQSTTKGRAIEALPLGTTMAGVINQIQADLASLVGAFNGQTYANGGHPSPVNISSGKIQASDGSVVPAKSGNQIALSKRGKVR